MNKLIKNIACTVMALTLITGVFTGCKANNGTPNAASTTAATAALPSFTSVKDTSGSLPEKGTVGDIEYTLLSKESFGCYNKDRGYYIDMLEQLDSPYYIVISAGTKTVKGYDIKISDFGMQGSTLVIVVEEITGSGDEYEGLNCPCAVMEVNRMPADLLIVSTTGEQFNKIEI